MSYPALLFIITILGVGEATTLHCSDPQSPDTVGIVSEDGAVNLNDVNVATLQYCIIDNCTIARSDTGQQLDVIYTTDSHIVATPRDMQTAVVIAKMDDELVCATPNMAVDIISTKSYIIFLCVIAPGMIVSGYNFIIHLIYKKLRNLIGKLLMRYSFFLAFHFVSIFLLMTANYKITVDSVMVCYATMITLMITYIGSEAVATTILTHIAYDMHQAHRLQQLDDDTNKHLYKRYIAYVLGSIILSLLLILSYDLATGNWRDTMLTNGHCIQLNQTTYGTMRIMLAISTINKVLQIAMFIIYLYYYYKVWNTGHNKIISYRKRNQRTNQELFKIGVAMGATIGLAMLFIVFNKISGVNSELVEWVAGILLFVQHCAILASFHRIRNIYKIFCKKQ